MAASVTTKSKEDASLLELDEESLYRQLFLQASQNAGGLFGEGKEPDLSDTVVVTPDPGVCIKTKDNNGEKVFINLCKTSQMPAPKDISEEELIRLLDSDDLSDYRVPLSIGEPHAEIDNSGNGCTAYDVMISETFFQKVDKNNLFKGFLMSVVFEGLEQKYSILLDRNWTQLKKRKCLGPLIQHTLRTKSKPRILEMDTSPADTEGSLSKDDNKPSTKQSSKPLIQEISEVKSSKVTEVNGDGGGAEEKAPEPKYTIMREPIDGHPEFLVVEIELPGVKTANTLSLDLGEDRILLHAHPKVYHLDIYLPFDVDQDFSGSQFNRDTQTLSLTLPVRPDL